MFVFVKVIFLIRKFKKLWWRDYYLVAVLLNWQLKPQRYLIIFFQVWEGRWRVIPHDVLPDWLKDNDFLLHGHRPPMPSFRACFKSIFRIHTETGNIWTHLLGMWYQWYDELVIHFYSFFSLCILIIRTELKNVFETGHFVFWISINAVSHWFTLWLS